MGVDGRSKTALRHPLSALMPKTVEITFLGSSAVLFLAPCLAQTVVHDLSTRPRN